MDVKSLDRIQLGTIPVAMYYLHDFIHRAEGVCCIIEVFCKTVGLVIVTEGSFVLFVPHGKSVRRMPYCNQGRKVCVLRIANSCFLHTALM